MKLTKQQRSVAERLKASGLSVMFDLAEGFSFGNGEIIDARVANNLIKKGVLVGAGDGMPGIGGHQTYHLKKDEDDAS